MSLVSADADAALFKKVDELEQFTVVKLKEELKKRGEVTTGTKPLLIERLTKYLKAKAEEKELLGLGDENGDASVDAELLGDDSLLEGGDASGAVAGTTKTKKPAVASKHTAITAPSAAAATAPAANGQSADAKPITQMTAEERRIERAKRFGVEFNAEEKKNLRAERFGLAAPSASTGKTISASKPSVDSEQLKKRAERFGIPVNEQSPEAKKLARASRFTSTEADPKVKSVSLADAKPDSAETEAAIRKRKERFGDVVATTDAVEEKKAKRAARFAT